MLPINPYNEESCKKLVHTKYAHLIRRKFGDYTLLNFKKNYEWQNSNSATPRLRAVSGQIPCATFYYTEFLVDINPLVIYDIGCGMNFFKSILPGVVGVDGVGNFDIEDIFDDRYVAGHEGSLTAAMSIDALHFIPLSEFSKRVLDFSRVIATNGRGYIAMNAARLVAHTDADTLHKLTEHNQIDVNSIKCYIDTEISKLPLDFLVAENLVAEKFDDCVDGNIRLVFQK